MEGVECVECKESVCVWGGGGGESAYVLVLMTSLFAPPQYEEVLELVVQYERQFKVLKDFLADHTSTVEAIKKRMLDQPDETWKELSEVGYVYTCMYTVVTRVGV